MVGPAGPVIENPAAAGFFHGSFTLHDHDTVHLNKDSG